MNCVCPKEQTPNNQALRTEPTCPLLTGAQPHLPVWPPAETGQDLPSPSSGVPAGIAVAFYPSPGDAGASLPPAPSPTLPGGRVACVLGREEAAGTRQPGRWWPLVPWEGSLDEGRSRGWKAPVPNGLHS